MLEGLEVVLHALTQAAGVYAEDRCQLEAADSDTALVTRVSRPTGTAPGVSSTSYVNETAGVPSL